MANEKFDIGKLIRGFNFTKGEILGKIIFTVIIAGFVCGIFYVLFFRPTHREIQKAETIINKTEIKQDTNEFQLIPPKAKVGGTVFKLFWFK